MVLTLLEQVLNLDSEVYMQFVNICRTLGINVFVNLNRVDLFDPDAAIIIVNRQRVILYANQYACDMYGHDDLRGKLTTDLVTRHDANTVNAMREKAMKNNMAVSHIICSVDAKGEAVPIKLTLIPVSNDEGHVYMMIGISQKMDN